MSTSSLVEQHIHGTETTASRLGVAEVYVDQSYVMLGGFGCRANPCTKTNPATLCSQFVVEVRHPEAY